MEFKGLEGLRALSAYELLQEREIPDLQSKGVVLRHKKTGARVALLSNDDENKVFSIAFRTPPTDSTGVAHIVEHTVLCGSEKYPLKDPFVELVKGSLNTFLNAMTYPDKTVYPVASCNFKDFCNLMDVYLDAVFYPKIYQEKKIFRQEGWHYEMEDPEDELKINGVVYNEMKGAFSNPDDVLARMVMNSLYPDTTYGIESGGDPEVIPELTYEAYLDFHRRYYHPSNSFIYLYGDLDMAERLDYLDKEYLSAFDPLQVDSMPKRQEAFSAPKEVTGYYPVSEGETEEEGAYLTYNISLGDNLDKTRYIAFEILDYAICSSPGAILRKRLIDAGIGNEVFSDYDNGILQPYFSIIAKGAKAADKEKFLQIIRDTLTEMAGSGIDQKALLAAINSSEFKYREADYGSYPKGLMYGLQSLDSWLYEDADPFRHIESNEVYAFLRAQAQGNTGYFETLIREDLLENTHASVVCLLPKKGLGEEREKALKDKLAAYKESLSKERIREICEATEALRLYQETPDTEEDILKLPQLTRQDLKKEAAGFVNEELSLSGSKVLFHEIYTNGILYLRLLFDCSHIPGQLFPYLGILKNLIGLMDTAHYSYGELYDQINLKTGGICPSALVYTDYRRDDEPMPVFELRAKVLRGSLDEAISLIREMLFTTKFEEEKRLRELIRETVSRMQTQMMGSGHSLAMGRAMSYQSRGALYQEELSGLSLYRHYEELERSFSTEKDPLVVSLKNLCRLLFTKENLFVDFTGEKKDLEELSAGLTAFIPSLYPAENKGESYLPVPERKNEGLAFASQVQFVARCGNFKRHGLPYTGAFRVLKVLMGYEYLWSQIRVRGGAYGCMCGFKRNGDSFFVSYRDPHLEETIDVYEKAAEFVKSFQADERTMTKYVIGAIGDLDVPMTPQLKAGYSLSAYLSGISYADVQKERDEVLKADPASIRSLGTSIDAFMSDDCLCVVGGDGKLKEAEGRFKRIEYLITRD